MESSPWMIHCQKQQELFKTQNILSPKTLLLVKPLCLYPITKEIQTVPEILCLLFIDDSERASLFHLLTRSWPSLVGA